MNQDSRDREINQARQVRDTLILQKVNGAQREAFRAKFPGQVEHMMRLTAERLQHILVNKPSDLSDTSTWSSSPADIQQLAQALHYLSYLNKDYPIREE